MPFVTFRSFFNRIISLVLLDHLASNPAFQSFASALNKPDYHPKRKQTLLANISYQKVVMAN